MSILALLQAAEYLEQVEQQYDQRAVYEPSDVASSVCSFDGEFSTWIWSCVDSIPAVFRNPF
jgi:hypothetical protein